MIVNTKYKLLKISRGNHKHVLRHLVCPGQERWTRETTTIMTFDIPYRFCIGLIMGALFNLNDFERSMFINEQRRQTFVKLLLG